MFKIVSSQSIYTLLDSSQLHFGAVLRVASSPDDQKRKEKSEEEDGRDRVRRRRKEKDYWKKIGNKGGVDFI